MDSRKIIEIARKQIRLEQLDAAIATCSQWLNDNPIAFNRKRMEERSRIFALLGYIFNTKGMLNEAITAYVNAILSDSDKDEIWVEFSNVIKRAIFNIPNDLIKNLIVKGLSRSGVNAQKFAIPGFSLLKLIPEFQELLQISNEDADLKLDEKTLDTLNDPLFLSLIKNVIIADQEFEKLMQLIRKTLMVKIFKKCSNDEMNRVKPLTYAVAIQCFFNEYLYLESKDESIKIELLIRDIRALSPPSMIIHGYILGCWGVIDLFTEFQK